MPPMRRETESQKKLRDDRAQQKEDERMKLARPVSDLERKLYKMRISGGGRLTR